jgi:hypothetical protein
MCFATPGDTRNTSGNSFNGFLPLHTTYTRGLEGVTTDDPCYSYTHKYPEYCHPPGGLSGFSGSYSTW